jgi:hypothetical protein
MGLLAAADFDVRHLAWKARWILPAGAEPTAYGVYHFRHTVTLDAKPASLRVHVTGDSRYELYVNGVKVSWGPARGDLYHWRYETVDIAAHLRPGRNVLAAVVWNDGPAAGLAQWSLRTGFLLQAGDTDFEKLNTGKDWVFLRNSAYKPTALPGTLWGEIAPGYYAIGPMEQFDAALYPWGWQMPDYDASAWKPVEVAQPGAPRDQSDSPSRWMLVERPIPMMEETPQRIPQLRKSEGAAVAAGFPAQRAAVTIAANSRAVLLLDQTYLTTGFPELEVSGGKGAEVTLRYAETLFQQLRPRAVKGNRNDVEGKEFRGYPDRYTADGAHRTYRPLFWRTWRYLQVTVQTKSEPLTIEDLRGVYTGYPFTPKAKLDTGEPVHQKMLEVGWRTARLCAHETYMDCPYYEQLQYAGDTRIQAMVSLYMTGDARLMRNAIEQLDSSRTSEGATYSRAPSVLQQYIPPFSLWWIGMLHDYWWYVDDPAFVKQMLRGARSVLGWYTSFLNSGGLLGPMPWWNYVDWVSSWRNGRPPCEPEVMPATIQLQLVLALQWAAKMEESVGQKVLAAANREQAAALAQTIRAKYWNAERKMFSEDLAQKRFSQHANVLAVLGGLVDNATAKDLMQRVEPDKTIDRCTVYFRYYLDCAMAKAGLGDRYVERLQTWDYMLKEGLTTWAEVDSPGTRSDCHAWGASPNVEFFRTVLGVDSAAPGFSKVRVQPHLGPLKKASGVVPHPKGLITVSVERRGAGYKLDVKLPPGVELSADPA